MMNKWIGLGCLLASIFLTTACEDKEYEPGKTVLLPPGEKYVKEGRHCLNVFYYIPEGSDTLKDWQEMISSAVLNVQQYYREQMTACGYPEKTFHLAVNDQNPNYVRVICLQGKTENVNETGVEGLLNEIFEYQKQHPEDNYSEHTVIFTTENILFSGAWTFTNAEGYGISSYILLPFLRESFSTDITGITMAEITQHLGVMFFLNYSEQPMSDVYVSMMSTNMTGNQWGYSTELKKADAMVLSRNQVFSDEDLAFYSGSPQLKVEKADFSYRSETDSIYISCEFTSRMSVHGVVIYEDPWLSENRWNDILDERNSSYDAIPYAVEELQQDGDRYRFTKAISWKDIPAGYKVSSQEGFSLNAEFRFRFVMENGLLVPLYKGDIKSGYRYPYTVINYWPDFDLPVDTVIPGEEPEEE